MTDAQVRSDTPRQRAAHVGRGALMGTADIIPGVSGGTVALILGIYTRLVDAIRSVDAGFLRAAIRAVTRGREGRADFAQAWRRVDGTFLVLLVGGIGLGLAASSRPLHWALEHHPVPMLALFFGLILASTIVPVRMIRRRRLGVLVLGAAGIAAAYWVTGLPVVGSPKGTWFVPVAGAVAIVAMILPGVSGAYLLVVLGMYQRMLEALLGLDVLILVLFAGGALVGILSCSRLLSYLLHRHGDPTMAVLAGLMLGSLRRVWPFKTGGTEDFASGQNVWPVAWTADVTAAVLAGGVGILLVWALDRWAGQGGPAPTPDPGTR